MLLSIALARTYAGHFCICRMIAQFVSNYYCYYINIIVVVVVVIAAVGC